MKKIKEAVILLIILFTINPSIAGERPEKLNSGMELLLGAVRMQRAAMANKDADALLDCAELYDSMKLKNLSYKIVEGEAAEPVVQFGSKYCQEFVANNCEVVKMEPAQFMRPLNAPALAGMRLGAGESVTIETSARNACEGMVLTETGYQPKVELKAGDSRPEDIEMMEQDEGSSVIFLWWQPEGERKIKITVTNPGHEAMDFLIALN